jgi:hypothetical protein
MFRVTATGTEGLPAFVKMLYVLTWFVETDNVMAVSPASGGIAQNDISIPSNLATKQTTDLSHFIARS